MNTKELLEKIARYKSAMEAETDADTKKKFQSRIDQLEKDIAQVEASVEKQEEKLEKQEDKAIEEAEKKLQRYKDAMDSETDPDTKAKFKKRIDDIEKQLKGVKEQIKEEKKEIEEQKKDIKDAVQDVQSAQKTVRTQAIKKAGQQVTARKTTTTKKKTRKKAIANIITKLDKLIDKNPALKAKYKNARGGSYMQYASVDLKRDAGRASKPFGYRFKGDNTKVPRPDQRGQSNVYYENRANRADVYPKRKIKLEDGGMMADGGKVKQIEFDGTKWYLTYIDPTHFFLSNSSDFKGNAYHIGQFKHRPFYNEVNEWLKTTSKSKMADGGLAGHGLMSTGGVVLNLYQTGADWKMNMAKQKDFDDYKSARKAGEKSGAFQFEIVDEITGDVMYSTHSEKMTPSLAYNTGGGVEDDWEVLEVRPRRKKGTYKMTDDTYVNLFLSKGFDEKRGSMGMRFFEHKPTGTFVTYDTKGTQTPIIISKDKSGEKSIYEGNSITEVKKSLDDLGITTTKEGVEYNRGGKTQGYDDRKDESLGMTRGKTASKDLDGTKEQKEKFRRDDAGFETRKRGRKAHKYSWKPEAKGKVPSGALKKAPSKYYANKFPDLVTLEKQ